MHWQSSRRQKKSKHNMFVIKLIAGIVAGVVMYIVGYNSLAPFMPSALAAVVAIMAGITLAGLVARIGT